MNKYKKGNFITRVKSITILSAMSFKFVSNLVNLTFMQLNFNDMLAKK